KISPRITSYSFNTPPDILAAPAMFSTLKVPSTQPVLGTCEKTSHSQHPNCAARTHPILGNRHAMHDGGRSPADRRASIQRFLIEPISAIGASVDVTEAPLRRSHGSALGV